MSRDEGARSRPRRWLAAGGPVVLTVAVVIGTLATARGPWRPRAEPDAPRLADVVSKAIEAEGIEAAVARYRALRQGGFPGVGESESETNALGYRLLRSGSEESAIRVFQLNVETHPGSANVYDSLGEAYLAAGERGLAIESYEKAVAIAPNKKTAVSALQQLTGRPRRPYPSMVLFHISAGALGLLSGAAAMSLRKGSRRHATAGSAFVVSMLSMSGSGAYMALVAPDGEVINVLMGALTFYLVATAWLTARRRSEPTGVLDWAALLAASALTAGFASSAVKAAVAGGSVALFVVFGAVALLAGVQDLRIIADGGISGPRRIARHLWRMCAALFIGVTSLFLGQPQVFPAGLRNTGLLAVPSLLVVVLLVFWLIRVSFTSAGRRLASIATVDRPDSERTPMPSTDSWEMERPI